MPPDDHRLPQLPGAQANHKWWGPQQLLWSSFSREPPVSYVDWVASRQRLAASQRGARRGAAPPSPLLAVDRAVFALSGLHSVYGRGIIGRALEHVCGGCATPADASASADERPGRRLRRVSAFYRLFVNAALQRLGQLYLPPTTALVGLGSGGGRAAADDHLLGVWISRGKVDSHLIGDVRISASPLASPPHPPASPSPPHRPLARGSGTATARPSAVAASTRLSCSLPFARRPCRSPSPPSSSPTCRLPSRSAPPQPLNKPLPPLPPPPPSQP